MRASSFRVPKLYSLNLRHFSVTWAATSARSMGAFISTSSFRRGTCPTSAAGSQLFGGGAAPVPGHPDFEEIPALAIVDDDGGQVLHLQAVDGLRSQFGEGDNPGVFDAPGDKGPGPTGGPQVNRLIFLHGGDDLRRAFAFADHGLQAQTQQSWRIGVHAVTGGGSGGADDPSRPGRRRAH